MFKFEYSRKKNCGHAVMIFADGGTQKTIKQNTDLYYVNEGPMLLVPYVWLESGASRSGFNPFPGVFGLGLSKDGFNVEGIFSQYAGLLHPPYFEGRSGSSGFRHASSLSSISFPNVLRGGEFAVAWGRTAAASDEMEGGPVEEGSAAAVETTARSH